MITPNAFNAEIYNADLLPSDVLVAEGDDRVIVVIQSNSNNKMILFLNNRIFKHNFPRSDIDIPWRGWFLIRS